MHIQIINFGLKDISDEEFRKYCEAVAPAFAALPGLVSKYWLADPETNAYGGVYVWRDRPAMEDYAKTDIYKGMLETPGFEDVTVKDFAVLEKPTRVTRGVDLTVQPRTTERTTR